MPDDDPESAHSGKMERTWLCSVMFLDVVGFSVQSNDIQAQWKKRFDAYLSDAIRAVPKGDRLIIDTGDGAAICFLAGPEAAMFAAFHLVESFSTDESRQQPRFQVRTGINIGPVQLVKDVNGNQNVIGDGINTAQRIMSFAGPNEVLVSRSFFEVVSRLSGEYPRLFRLEGGKKDKQVREHIVYRLVPPGFPEKASRPSRRRLIQYSSAVAAAGAAAAWVGWPRIYSALHPLPDKRFVALMAWPTDTGESGKPVLNEVLDAIARRLIRAEAAVKGLLVIRPSDVPGPMPMEPKEAIHALGANLVLAASLPSEREQLTLWLRILDAAGGKSLRELSITIPKEEAAHLPERASIAAAALLQIPAAGAARRGGDAIPRVDPAAYAAFAAAQELMRQPNDTKLDEAIARYQQALEADPTFALGYAKLTMAYVKKYRLRREPAALRLAELNSAHAVELEPESAQSVISSALVDLYNGKTEEAMRKMALAQRVDPGNTEILMYQAIAFRDLDRSDDEEKAYRNVLRQRPNYWPAYNELGRFLYRHGRLEAALAAFQEASTVAPQVALPLTNAGSLYMMLHRRDEGIEAFQKSLRAAPNEPAYIALGNIAFEDRAYTKALDYYQKAHDFNPRSHQVFRDIGDSYAMLGNPAKVTESYDRAASLLQEELKMNPRSGGGWMRLAFYDAKSGRDDRVDSDIREGETRGASDVTSQFLKAQALAVMGRKEEATQLVLECLTRGLSPIEVDFALDLKSVRADPRYRKKVAGLQAKKGKAG